MIAYLGYDGYADSFELYDLQNDPEEMLDLSMTKSETLSELRHEVDEKLYEINESYG